MTNQHPITPPPELVQQWVDTYFGGKISQSNFHVGLAARAAQWGADQELEACCEWLSSSGFNSIFLEEFRAYRRPKPPSLKEQAIAVLEDAELDAAHYNILLRALEQIDD